MGRGQVPVQEIAHQIAGFEQHEPVQDAPRAQGRNAGIGAPDVPLEEVTYEQWSAVVGVKLTGAVVLHGLEEDDVPGCVTFVRDAASAGWSDATWGA